MQISTSFQRKLCSLFVLAAGVAIAHPQAHAQSRAGHGNDSTSADSTRKVSVSGITVSASRVSTVQPMPDVRGTSLFSGIKSEQIMAARVDANLSGNNTRQMFSHSPGIFVWEFDGSGIQANIAARGLYPHRSSEFNVRMNGYDIASDPYGYPEVHFTPPFESLDHIELVRGAASLQYGSQIGGLLNYVTKTPPSDRAIALETSQFGGSYGLYSTYTSIGGTLGDFSYLGYIDYRRSDSWRQNSAYWSLTGHVNLAYQLTPDAKLDVQFTSFDFKQHMANGLTEAQYAADSRASYRPRDYFGAPRIMPAITYEQKFSEHTHLSVLASGLVGERNSITLVTSTAILDTGTNRRRVNRDLFKDVYLEPRLLTDFSLFGVNDATLATGFRIAHTSTNRGQGLGFDGSDFNLEYNGPKTLDIDFSNNNFAAFAELKLALTDKFSITPGVRIEHLTTNANGHYNKEKSAVSLFAFDTAGPMITIDRDLDETFPLFGLTAALDVSDGVKLYGNFAQSYRPLLYAQQYPYDLVPTDTAITSSKGYSSDIGVRGAISNVGSFDIGGFFLTYNNRVGIIRPDSVLYPVGYRTNVGASRHYGLESFVQVDLLGIASNMTGMDRTSSLMLFTSAGYTSAKYIDGPVKGHEVENSPDWIVRAGLTFKLGEWLSTTLEDSYVGSAFSDAANTVYRADGQQGTIPAYNILDISVRAEITKNLRVEGSINNLGDRKYFTARATNYPGPGILPGDGRTFSAGLRLFL